MAGIQGLQHMTLHGVDAMIKSWHDENGCVFAHFPLRKGREMRKSKPAFQTRHSRKPSILTDVHPLSVMP